MVFVEAYKPHSGSGGENYLIRSPGDLAQLANKSAKGTLLFLGRWRPLKVVADHRLYERLSSSVSEGVEIAIGKEAYFPEVFSPYYPETTQELRESIEDYEGAVVLVGEEPSFPDRYWEVDETEDVSVVSAI